MKTRISLYGALREVDPRGYVELDLPDGSDVAMLRRLLAAWLHEHAPATAPGLVAQSAFATGEAFLHDHSPVPDGVDLAVLPPVSGG